MEKSEEKKWSDFEFTLFGSTWKVKYVDFIPVEDDEKETIVRFGKASEATEVIQVALSDGKGLMFSDQQIKLTLMHELIHAILSTGQYSCTNDEPMVEWLARCIFDIHKQRVFEHVE